MQVQHTSQTNRAVVDQQSVRVYDSGLSGTFLAFPACFKEWPQVNVFSCMKPGTTDHILRSASGPRAPLTDSRFSGFQCAKTAVAQCYGRISAAITKC